MSAGYAQAMTGMIDLMSGASADAAYESAYGTFYSAHMKMRNAANQKVAAEANIAAIRQDRVNTDKMISMKQDEAEARRKVTAAVLGTEGQSIGDSIYQTKVGSAFGKSNAKANANNQIEKQVAAVYSANSTMLSVGDTKYSMPNMASTIMADMAGYITTQGDEIIEGVDGIHSSKNHQKQETVPPLSHS